MWLFHNGDIMRVNLQSELLTIRKNLKHIFYHLLHNSVCSEVKFQKNRNALTKGFYSVFMFIFNYKTSQMMNFPKVKMIENGIFDLIFFLFYSGKSVAAGGSFGHLVYFILRGA